MMMMMMMMMDRLKDNVEMHWNCVQMDSETKRSKLWLCITSKMIVLSCSNPFSQSRPGRKKIFSLYNAIAILRKQLHTVDSAALSNTMMDIAEATNQVLPKALEGMEKVAEMMEKMQEAEDMVKEAQDVIQNMNMSVMEEEPMDDAHFEQLLNEITTPPPPPPPTTTTTTTTTTASSPSGMQVEGTEQSVTNGMSTPVPPLPSVEPTAPMPIHTMEM